MSNSKIKWVPYEGILAFDLGPYKDDIVDLPENGKKNLKFEKDNIEGALDDLQKGMSGALAAVGVAMSFVDRIFLRTHKLAGIRVLKGHAMKILEVLDETEAYLEDLREADIAVVAKAIQAAKQHLGPGVAAPFENLLKYYSQIADKAAATRKKNEKAKAASDAALAEMKAAAEKAAADKGATG